MRPQIFHTTVLSLLVGLITADTTTAQNTRHQQIVVSHADTPLLRSLPSFDPHALWSDAEGTHAILSVPDVNRLIADGIVHAVEIDDVSRYYADRAAIEMKGLSDGSIRPLSATDPAGFRFGSVGGHFSLDEIYGECARLRAAYPQFVSDTIRIGESVEGRGILAIRIASPNVDEVAPEALWVALIHSRESIGMMSAFYSAWDLLERYGSDPETTALLDEHILWIIPVANPDGYQYNVETDPSGGGLWRKNRGADGQGVDLNRNFGSFEDWSLPVEGGSNDVTSNTYRGPAPFSEPESRAIRDFILAHHISSVVSHHSFSNVLITPPYGEEHGIDAFDDWLFDATRELNREAGFGPGPSPITVGYPVSGSYELWASKQVNGDGSEIYSWVPETGSDADGFWPPPSRILALCRRLNGLNRRALRMAGPHAVVQGLQLLRQNAQSIARVEIVNVGTRDMTSDGIVEIDGDINGTTTFPSLDAGERDTLLVPITVIVDSARLHARIVVDTDGATWRDEWLVLRPDQMSLYEENFSFALNKWDEGDWDVETTADRGRVISDSPYNPYTLSSIPSVLRMEGALSTEGYDALDLNVSATTEIYAREHALLIEVRGDGGEWRRVDGRYLQTRQDGLDTLHSELRGDNGRVRRYTIPLDAFAGQNVEVRFVMNTPFVPLIEQYDGALLDDVEIRGAKRGISGIGEEPRRNDVMLAPNPTDGRLRINGVERFSYVIDDLLGRSTGLVGHDVTRSIDVGALPSGVYVITIFVDGSITRLPFYRR